MSRAAIRGAEIHFEVLGREGPWCILTAAGRFDLSRIRPLAQQICDGGYRAVIHDRRNIGASDVAIGPETAEDDIFVEDMVDLLGMLDARPAFAIGAGGGVRPTLGIALRHAEAVRGCICIYPSGGEQAARILAELYYGQYAELAERGGMAAICETPVYSELIERNPRNRRLLLEMNPAEFAACLRRWEQGVLASGSWPTIGFSQQMLRQIAVPTLVFPGLRDDHIHGYQPGIDVARYVPGARTVELKEDRKPAGDDGSWYLQAMRRRMTDSNLAPAILAFMDEICSERASAADVTASR